MIDQELDQLSRALIAATDRLNSDDFRARQARLVQIEEEIEAASIRHEEQRQQILADFNATRYRLIDERDAQAEVLEAEEKAVEAAQAALTSYVNGNYLDLGGVADEAEDDGPSGMVAGLLFGGDRHVRIDDDGIHEITPLPTEEEQSWDETASARGSGGLNDFPN